MNLYINKFPVKRPWNNREFLRLLIYIAQHCNIKLESQYKNKEISIKEPFKINKILAIVYGRTGYPKNTMLLIFHFGFYDPTLNKYLRLEIKEGYIKNENGQLKLTAKGEKYVKTILIPNFEDDALDHIARLLVMPLNSLEHEAYNMLGFKVEKLYGKQILRFINLDDLKNFDLKNPKIKILFNTLFYKIPRVRSFVENEISLINYPKINVKTLQKSVKISQNFRKALIKTKIPAAKSFIIVELKNAILNRFIYILTIYLINVLEGRYASFKEIYLVTHDWIFEASQKIRDKRFKKFASEKEKIDIKRRKMQAASSRVVRNDLNFLVEVGFLRKDPDTNSYAITALTYTDGINNVRLPSPDIVKELYELFNDELIIIDNEHRAYKRGFGGDIYMSELKFILDRNLPKVRIVDWHEKKMQLTRLRGQGILTDREEINQILYRIYKAIFQMIKDIYNMFEQNSKKIQVILVLRDAIVAYLPAIEEFKDSPIGLIGHVREVTQNGVSNISINFERYENPSNFDLIIVVDPMLATGNTLLKIISHLKSKCVKNKKPTFIVASVLACRDGVMRLSPEVDAIFCASLEEKLLRNAWLKPGLRGIKDLGDIIFKTKIDWIVNS